MQWKKLGELLTIKTGKLDANASSENGKYPFFTCSREPLRIDTFSYDCECVLVAGNGDLNVKYYKGKFDAYQRTYILENISEKLLRTRYLYYFMNKYVEKLRIQSIGGVIKYIKLENLTEAKIPLFELDTQDKIVRLLDNMQSIIDKRNQQIEGCDELIKTRFVEMFGHPIINPKRWLYKPLSECLENIENGRSFVCEKNSRTDEFPAILKLSAATYGVYNPNENKALTDENLFVDAAEVHNGDLLFTRKNTPNLVGMCAYVNETPPKLMMPDLIFRLNTKENCNKIYLWKLINHELFREKIKKLASGSAQSMSNISKERLMKLEIPIPQIDLQNQFATFVQEVDKLKIKLQNSLSEMEDNMNALMQKTFKGELFPED